MMPIQSIWLVVAFVVCAVVALALALGVWLMVWDPDGQVQKRPMD